MNSIDKKKDLNKIRNNPTVNEDLDLEYGKVGTSSREKFNIQAHAYYTGQRIENARKNAHLTQDAGQTNRINYTLRTVKQNLKYPLFIGLLQHWVYR